MVFNRLTVIGQAEDKVYQNGRRKAMWNCICECGNECDICGSKLKNGTTKSCGCLQKERTSETLTKQPRKYDLNGNVIEKQCACCKQWKQISDFKKAKNKVDGHDCYCKECLSYSLSSRYSSYKYNAKNRGFEFNLTIDEFDEITKRPCFYCGEYDISYLGENYNGVDRIDNANGYTAENSVSCCEFCNRMKLDHTLNEWLWKINKINSRTNTILSYAAQQLGIRIANEDELMSMLG